MLLSVGGRRSSDLMLTSFTVHHHHYEGGRGSFPLNIQSCETWLEEEMLRKWSQNTEPQDITMTSDYMMNVC